MSYTILNPQNYRLRFLCIVAYAVSIATACIPNICDAHFLFVIPPQAGEKDFSVVFGEGPEADDPEYLQKFSNPKATLVGVDGKSVDVALKLLDDRLVGIIPADLAPARIFVQADWGMFERDDKSFMLTYYATAICNDKGMSLSPLSDLPTNVQASPQLAIVRAGEGYQVLVTLHQKPLGNQTIRVVGASPDKLQSDSQGLCAWSPKSTGTSSLVTSITADEAGKWNDEQYSQVKRYSTLTVFTKAPSVAMQPSEAKPSQIESSNPYPEITEAVTSFGAARIGDSLFIYGGHTGDAHDYWNESQSNSLSRLDLKAIDQGWQKIAQGPRLQGLAMVAYKDRLIRIGGFAATNKKDDEQNLVSTNSVAELIPSNDPNNNVWKELPPLPEPRSSTDATIIGDDLYVAGGWQLGGAQTNDTADRKWHQTAWKMDLSAATPTWEAIAAPPFQRRAAALCGYKNRLYVIGGMTGKGEPTTEVEVLDLATQTWSKGPSLPGEGMSGFGAAALEINGRLIATTHDGKVVRLSEDTQSWELLGETANARFFHRMLPIDEKRFVSIGGASMSEGKFTKPEVVFIKD